MSEHDYETRSEQEQASENAPDTQDGSTNDPDTTETSPEDEPLEGHHIEGDSTFKSAQEETVHERGGPDAGEPYESRSGLVDPLQQPTQNPAHLQEDADSIEGATGEMRDQPVTHTSTGQPPVQDLVDQQIDERIGAPRAEDARKDDELAEERGNDPDEQLPPGIDNDPDQ